MNNQPGFRPISLDKYQAVIHEFGTAIKRDDDEWRAFDQWQLSGKSGKAPELNDHVGTLSLRYAGLGMSPAKLVTLRETAFRIFEAGDDAV